MANEHFERHMQFIVEQQAQFAVDIQQLKEAQAELTKKHNHLTEALTTVVGVVGKLTHAQERTDEKLSETDDRLNALIGVVERYFSGNGASPKKPKSKSSIVRKATKGTRR
ncbi:MAG TPA: hypothetical protein VJV21_07795 [Pyrinomonadaceae bacterium]|nr:hypothetical protein [Pyrinomonadaceae bacterium]